MPAKPVRIAWELEAKASIERTWALFSDTDRYNRAVGFGFSFKDTPQDDGSVERTGTASVMGMRFVWDELPFEYRENEWYKIRRCFRSGPAKDVTVTLRLAPRGTHTAIRYAIEVVPRTLFTRPLVQMDLNSKTKPKIQRVLDLMLARLANADVSLDPEPPTLSAEGEAFLTSQAATMTHREVGQHLSAFIRTGPLPAQNQIHARAFARLWRLTEDETVRGLLEATRVGLVDMQWDLLCPMCRGAKLRTKTLPLNPPEAHCASCNIRYDGGFADAIGISFRTTRRLRTFEVTPACIGSPALQPQVIAQDNIDPGEHATFVINLPAGLYRVRTIPARYTASILVEDGGQTTDCRFTVGHNAMTPERTVMKAGLCHLLLQNDSPHRIAMCLDKRHLPEHVMTAGQLLERYAHTGELPEWLFEPSQRLTTRHCCIVAVQVADWAPSVLDALKRWSSAAPTQRLKQDGSTVVVVFDDVDAALTALKPMLGHADMAVGLGTGEVIEASSEAFTTQFGAIVQDVLMAASACRPGHACVVASAESDLREPLRGHGWEVSPSATSLGRDTWAFSTRRLNADKS